MTEKLLAPLEIRQDDNSPGRLTGVLVTYGKRALDRPEIFEAGALDLAARRD